MLDIGSFRTRDGHAMTRRAFVRTAAGVPAALGLSALSATAAETKPGTPRAKSVMMVWLWGGPSQLDTFDPKPDAPSIYRGPFATIATRNPGVRFSEPFPRLAARSDQFSVIRSTVFSTEHGLAPLTGEEKKATTEPNFGSIVAKHHPDNSLPPFISLVPPKGPDHTAHLLKQKGRGGGSMGSGHDPFLVSCSAEGETRLTALKLLDGLSPQRLADRQALRTKLDRIKRQFDDRLIQWDHQSETAYRLLTAADSVRAFELSREPEKVRDAYGHTSFGQSMLLGRRLVEAGVRYVQVNWSLGVDSIDEGTNTGWDTHANNFGLLVDYLGPILDRALSALLDDLADRGLLESTLVVVMGEMGRTPKINDKGGRDHWATCSTLWSGGGVQGGRIIWATDRIGGEPVTKPIDAQMVGTTILDTAGVDQAARVEMKVLPGGQVIHELF